jgi:hypothetical protein
VASDQCCGAGSWPPQRLPAAPRHKLPQAQAGRSARSVHCQEAHPQAIRCASWQGAASQSLWRCQGDIFMAQVGAKGSSESSQARQQLSAGQGGMQTR